MSLKTITFIKLKINSYRALLIILLTAAIAIQGGNDFSFFKRNSIENRHKITLNNIKEIFPIATDFNSVSENLYYVFSVNGDTIGTAIPTFVYAKKVKGFAGEVPVLIGFNRRQVIKGMTLLKHHESQEYMEYIIDDKLLYRWNSKTIPEALDMQVDAITAATETSHAIIEGVRVTFSEISGKPLEPNSIGWRGILQFALTIATIIFALLVCYKRKLKKYRTHMLIMVAIVMGFMYKTMLSVALLHGWVVNGLPWTNSTLIVILLFLCIVLPFTTKKQFYCHYMCPYGAVQELAGKVSPIKKKRSMNWLKYKGIELQTVLFIILLILLLTGFFPELSFIEPFPSFSYEIVSWGMIAFGVVFIGLSFFYSKPWCKICPTGFIFDSCKKQNNTKKTNLIFNMKTSEILNLLLVVVIIILLLKGGGVDANETNEISIEKKDSTVLKTNNVKLSEVDHVKKSIGKRPTMFPMPTLVIGSYNPDGQPNIMSAAWGGIVNSRPLSIGVSLRKATQTYKNIMKTGAFTVNYASEEHVAYVDWIGEHSGKDVNKFEILGLTPIKSNLVNAPYVKEFGAIVELKVVKTIDLGSHTQFVGEVVDTKIDKRVLIGNTNKIDIKKMKPILVGTSWKGYYGFGDWIGTPGKAHNTLGIKLEE